MLVNFEDPDLQSLQANIKSIYVYYNTKKNMHDNINIRLSPSADHAGGVKTSKEFPQESLVAYYKRIGFNDMYDEKTLYHDTLGTDYKTLIAKYLTQLPHSGGFRKTKSKKIKSNKQIQKKSKKSKKNKKL